jgi:regulator of nucleoside diphosphate kinase
MCDVTFQKQLKLTDVDRLRLREMMESLAMMKYPFRAYVRRLDAEMADAAVVPAASVEPDVVTMNSYMRIEDLETGKAESITLVYPTESDMLRSRLSVLSPLGIELIGQRAGDTVEWTVPGGVRRVRIDRVLYQPEAAGHFHL